MIAGPVTQSDRDAPTGGWALQADATWTSSPNVTLRVDVSFDSFVSWLDPDAEKRLLHRQLSHDALAWAVAHSDVAPPPALEARHGYQDAPRLPCYRAVRTR